MLTKKLTDSYDVAKILLNEIFHNVFSNPLFSKKRNRYILLLLVIAFYLAYYFINISQLNQIFTSDEMLTNDMINLLFSSLSNTIIIITGVIYLLVTVSFSLTEKMKYLLKILPFEKHSILMGTILFKLLMSYSFFLVIFTIIIPLLKLFYFSLTLNILILIYCQILFFTGTALYHLVFHTFSHFIKLNKYNLNIILLVVLLFFYYFVFRFKIDEYMMGADFTVNLSLVGMLIAGLIVLIGLFSYGVYRFQSNDENIYMSNDFFIFKRVMHMNYFMIVILGFIRNRLTLSLIGIVGIICLLSFIDTRDISISLETLIYVYPIVSFAAIRYYSTTLSYRTMNPLFRIGIWQETIATTLTNILINLPLIIGALILLGEDNMEMMYFGLILFESAIIMSIIFPKQKSSVNEFGASILCVILATALYLISSNVLLFGLLFIILVLVKNYLLERSVASETL